MQIIDNTLSVNESIIGNMNVNVTNKFLDFIDTIADSIDAPSFEYAGQHIGMAVETVNNSVQTELAATLLSSNKIGITVNDDNNKDRSKNIDKEKTLANIQIPRKTYLSDKQQHQNKTFKVISTVFRKSTFFATKHPEIHKVKNTNNQSSKVVVGSVVMSASVKDYVIQNLTDPVKLDFKVTPPPGNGGRSNGRCVYWETGMIQNLFEPRRGWIAWIICISESCTDIFGSCGSLEFVDLYIICYSSVKNCLLF